MKITRVSPMSGEHTMDLPVTQAQLDELGTFFFRRRLIQDIFPDLTPAQREFIKTGYTEEDWERMFPPEPHYDSIWKEYPMPVHYTCTCGIYVHPTKRNPHAIHIKDCPYHD